jgi:glycerate kinase
VTPVPPDPRADPPALLAVPDKFRGTASAGQVCGAIARGAASQGWTARHVPLSDGGEGFLDTFGELGGRRETTEVEGPLGEPVPATWLLAGSLAVIEMAQASGLVLAGGAEGNDVMRASTRGTGELIVAAARAVSAGPGATVVVGLGGSATTDGGLGALTAVQAAGGLDGLGGVGGVTLIGACDVDIGFVEAAAEFAPQKGATEAQVAELGARLSALADRYRRDLGIDVRNVPGAGAAGGMGGAIVALGGRLRSGYQVVRELLHLDAVMGGSSLVVTGEGALDAMSFRGKVVGSVLADAAGLGVPALVVVGRATPDGWREAERHAGHVVSLVDRFGEDRALADTETCVEQAVGEYLDSSHRTAGHSPPDTGGSGK